MTTPYPAPVIASMLTIEGADAPAFAHAQFTSDVLALEPGRWQWSAWLDARGRVQFLFQLARTDQQSFVALLRGGHSGEMAERLGRFVFRSRVTLTAHQGLAVTGGTPRPAFGFAIEGDSCCFGLGDGGLEVPGTVSGDNDWRLRAIRHGEPWLPDPLLDTLLPPALGLHRLGAMSLDKGCYPGQEIVARLHFRGGHKHALAHLRLHAPVAAGANGLPEAPGDPASATIAAQVLDCVPAGEGHEALAVLHADAFAALRDARDNSRDAPILMQRFEP